MASAVLERVWRRLLLTGLALLAGLAAAATAQAHPMPESRLWVDTQPQGLRLTALLPLNRLEMAVGLPLSEAPDTVLARHGDALARYLLQHVGARSQGVGWQVLRPELKVLGHDTSAELQATLELRAPPGADPRLPVLQFDAITHALHTHRVLVFLRNDWAAGRVGDAPQPLGELQHGHATLSLALPAEQPGASGLRLIVGGAWHIAEGADHLLFLLMLLLTAPLRSELRHWVGVRPVREGLRRSACLLSAFTAGHTVTLVLGSLAWLTPGSQGVELAVAATVGLAALHAWRPLFTRAEAVMALIFGCVHGLAFSASLSGAGLSAEQQAVALLCFNFGIELMQLLLMALLLPPLWLLARDWPSLFTRVRQLLAVGTGLAAAWWFIERLGLTLVAEGPWVDTAIRVLYGLPLPLWGLALWVWVRQNPQKAKRPAA